MGEDYMDLTDYKDNDADCCKWANLVGYEEVITTTIQKMEGDPKTVQEAWSCSDWPKWKEAMDCKISLLKHARTWMSSPGISSLTWWL